jgi:hypothetical protein
LNPDTDGGGMLDGDEVGRNGDPLDPTDDFDPDRDGLLDDEEAQAGSDPDVADTDGDGLSDGDEVHEHGTDPTKADTDDGGVPDGEEIDRGTDPLDGSDDLPLDMVYKGGCDCDQTGASGSARFALAGLLLAVGLSRRR